MLNLGVLGADGRIGDLILEQIAATTDLQLTYAVVDKSSPKLGQPTGHEPVIYSDEFPTELERPCDVFIDFSVPAGTAKCLAFCLEHKIPLVTGTTGHATAEQARVEQAAKSLPLLQASNMSPAVNACFLLVEQAAKLLGVGYDVELLEKHHKHKIDAPSGTALTLAERVAAARGQSLAEVGVYDRSELRAPRKPGAIGIQAIRGGEIAGEHDVLFISADEQVTISHHAYSRGIFAAGAIRAARWLAGQTRPGLYDIKDILG